jgi:hypothetical protein
MIRLAREHIDAAAGGSFFALSIEEARALIEKMTSSHSWIDEHAQSRTHKVHQLEEVDILTAKIDLLIKKLEDSGLDHIKMVDSHMTYEECGDTCHMGINCPTVYQNVNFIRNCNGFHVHKGFHSGWNKPRFPFNNYPQCGNGHNFNRNEPSLRDIVRDQVKINDNFGNRLQFTNKLLENMNGKMDSFTIAIQNQLSFNKMLETQIQQITGALPSQSNGLPSKDSVQENVNSITAIFEGLAPGSSETSLGIDEGNSKVSGEEIVLPMFEVSSDVILNRPRNQFGGPKVLSIQCILGPLKVHYALYD